MVVACRFNASAIRKMELGSGCNGGFVSNCFYFDFFVVLSLLKIGACQTYLKCVCVCVCLCVDKLYVEI